MECPACGEQDIIEDVENGTNIKVCSNCGRILSESQVLTSEPSFEGTTASNGTGFAPSSLVARATEKEPEGRKEGIRFIKRLAEIYHFKDFMTEGALNLYCKVYEKSFRYSHDGAKKIMCICCLFVVARENDYALSVRDFNYFLKGEGRVRQFSTMLGLLREQFGVSVKPVCITHEAEFVLLRVGFPQSLINQTKNFLSLLNEMIGFDGKSRCLVIIAVSYLIWKASDVRHKKTSLKTFCSRHKMAFTQHVLQRKQEIVEAVRKLIPELPWVQSKGSKSLDIDFYLNDVIKFRRFLMQKRIREARKSLEDGSDCDTNVCTESEGASKTRRPDDTVEHNSNPKKAKLDLEGEDLDASGSGSQSLTEAAC